MTYLVCSEHAVSHADYIYEKHPQSPSLQRLYPSLNYVTLSYTASVLAYHFDGVAK